MGIQEQVKPAICRAGVDTRTPHSVVECTKKQERAGIYDPAPALACITWLTLKPPRQPVRRRLERRRLVQAAAAAFFEAFFFEAFFFAGFFAAFLAAFFAGFFLAAFFFPAFLVAMFLLLGGADAVVEELDVGVGRPGSSGRAQAGIC